MAGTQEKIYVLIEPIAYSPSPTVVGAYTDRATAEAIALDRGYHFCPAVIYHHQALEIASSDDIEDGEPEVKKTKTTKKAKAAKEDGAAKKVSKRTAVPEGDPQSLAGQTYMLAGTLHHMDHKTFTRAVELYGGTHTTKLADANVVVIGANPGKKVDDVSEKGVTIMDEERFFEGIGAEYPEPPAKRVKKST